MAFFTAFNIGKDMAMSIQFEGGILSGDPGSPLFANIPLPGFIRDALNINHQGSSLTSEDLGQLLTFNSDPSSDTVTKFPANRRGAPVFVDRHLGWHGTFEIVRQTAVGELLAQMFQDAYLLSVGQISCTITQVIISPLGGATQRVTWTFPKSALRVATGGTYRTDEGVVQQYQFNCAQRLPGGFTGQVSKLEAAIATQFAAFQLVQANKTLN